VNLLPFFQWCEASRLGDTIRQSLWLFPVIEAVHLLALCVMGGSLLLLDLRLLGVGLRNQPVRQLSLDIRPWLVGSMAIMVMTGVGLFTSEAIKCYYNTSFWVKISTIPLAMLFTFTIRERVAARAGMDATATTKMVAVASIVLWFVVAAAGRWIGFSG
jgi:uncharacterized protein DUF6644